MNVACDFDGTIRGYDGTVLTKIIDLIKQDIDNGDTVFVITNNKDKKLVKDFVNQYIGDVTICYTKDIKDKINVLSAEHIDMYYNDDIDENKAIVDELEIQVINVTADQSQERLEAMQIPVKKYGDKTVLVFDHGLYFHVAQKLSESFGCTLYYTPWESGFPISNDTLIGSGFDNVERINKFFDYIDKVDLFVFCDIYHSDLQTYLQKIGKRVWGARRGDEMEIFRWDFIQTMKSLGMPVPETELVIGIENLRNRLQEVENKFIKTDAMTRGDIETFQHINYGITCPILDKLAYSVGPRANQIRFIIQDPIPTTAEIGYDGYTIDGQFPDMCLFGLEVKDKGYVGEMRNYNDIPKEIKVVNDYLAPLFKQYGYRGMFSTEIRVGEDGKSYLIDPTCRFPSPPTSVMMELFENIAEIMYEGADGNLVQIETSNKFGAEIIGTSEFALDSFVHLCCEDEDMQFIKQPNICMIDDKIYTIPQKYEDMNMVCNVVAVGTDIDTVIKDLTERCDRIQAHKLSIDCSILNGAIDELKKL
jgi:hypothetical protein